MPTTQLSANERQAVAIRLPEVSTLKMITGLNTFSSRCPLAPATETATWLPITCAATMVSASARSEEHTSELQSLMRISYAVFCLKKKKKHHNHKNTVNTIVQNEQHTTKEINTQ